ncbi:MAG TPA: lipid IV(A) 3-deoxy-D-manno-octulosonic acid transferase [Steroidobacteraceae bacterium]|jgi:3-deoxy-D-manno-octulosonic-acid transferase
MRFCEGYRRWAAACSLSPAMLRLIYTVLIYMVAPVAFAVTAWRGIRNPAYRERLPERFGFTAMRSSDPVIWVHAVSVGEVQAAAALIRRLRQRYPQKTLVVTTATPTGAQRVRALFGDSVAHCYLPYDLPGAVRRFLDRVRPAVAIIVETEVWPNLFRECGRRNLPIVLASARLSEKSVRRFRWVGGLFRAALARDIVIGAQTALDAERFLAVGSDAARTLVTGNIKFDLEIPAEVRAQGLELRTQFAQRFVWVAGSTHEGEEQILLDAHRRVQASRPDALLVLVPRHPDRFERVRNWLSAQGASYATRSRHDAVTATTAVLLVDTLGELLKFYAAADVAFVGGSLVPIGGHNLLEPAALALPILTGPHNFNAPDVARLLLQNGAAKEVRDANELSAALLELCADPSRRDNVGRAALAIVEANRGAVARVVRLIEPVMRE